MEALPSAKPHTNRWTQRGVTLIETALAMMILSVLAVGVSSLVRTGVEGQMSQRVHANMQTIAMNVVDDLRFDIRTASSASITGSGTRLTLTTADGDDIVYELSGDNLRRTVNGGTLKIYNTGYTPQLRITCLSTGGASVPCFEGYQADTSNPGNMIANNTNPRQIRINNITVQQMTNGNSVIDQNFGVPNFPVRAFAFDLMSAKEFQ